MTISRPISKIIAVTSLVVALSGDAIAADVSRSIPIDKDFEPANIRWNGPVAGGYDALVAFKVNQGRLELCGVGIVTNIQFNSSINKGLRGGEVRVNGKRVLRNFSYFAKAKNIGSLKKTRANCRLTSFKMGPEIKKLEFDYGDASVRN